MVPYLPQIFRQRALTNIVDPDQTAPKAQFDQGLLYLPFSHNFLDTISGRQWAY